MQAGTLRYPDINDYLSEFVDLGPITSEQIANAGKIMPDKAAGAWSSADATIAATQRMAFPMRYLLFIRLW
jgi:predicted RNA-binding protein associated with RNAse of E/G family